MYTLITLRVKHFLALREAEREKKSYFMSLPTVIIRLAGKGVRLNIA